jgi:hypothetical protein
MLDGSTLTGLGALENIGRPVRLLLLFLDGGLLGVRFSFFPCSILFAARQGPRCLTVLSIVQEYPAVRCHHYFLPSRALVDV